MEESISENKKATDLQKKAAACTDKLLDISNEIGKSVIPAYKETENNFFELSAKLQMGRLKALFKELSEIKAELEKIDKKALSNERAQSTDITLHMIDEDLALVADKELLISELAASDERTKEALAAASKLEDTAQEIRLRNALRKELGKCESEK